MRKSDKEGKYRGRVVKKIIFLGGFPQMIDIVFVAREMGIYTIVVDRNEKSPAKQFADEAINISTDNIDEIEKFCIENGVDGVFTGFEDFNIHIAQELCERLNMPFYATKEQLKIITNKDRFKKECRKYGVPVIEQYDFDEAVALKKYPYIVKPADSYGSRGITIAKNEEDLKNGLKKAVLVSQTSTAVIERFIGTSYGTELFYTIINEKIYLTVTADRYTVRTEDTTVPLPVAEVFPSKHRDEMVRTIDKNIREMLKGMGIKNGLVLIQALYEDGEFFVYEMAYRFTGEQHYRLVLSQNGVSLAKFMIKLALSEDVSDFETDLLKDESFTKPSINLAVVLKPGTIKEITGLDKVYQIDEVISYNLTHKNGDCVNASGDYSHMLIRVNMVAENYEKLKKAIKNVRDYVRVTSCEGEDMIVSPFVLEE